MATYRAVESVLPGGQPTGASRTLQAGSRAEAIQLLLTGLGVDPAAATVSASGRLVAIGQRAWTIIAPPPSGPGPESASLRRGGPTHRRTS